MPDYTRICFVVMPFGQKTVGDRMVDFDDIYKRIFAPAVEAAALPPGEKGHLEPHRTDQDFFAGNISTEMFQYLEYSRVVLADITGLNPNVFYELGHRHRARESGTMIVRQVTAPIPFDITTIKAFPYEYEPEDHATESRALITRALQESLVQDRPDSPVQAALSIQLRHHSDVETLLIAAENAIRNDDRATALVKYREAATISFANPLIRLKLGLLQKDNGNWKAALDEFNAAVQYAPAYADGWREKGIAENKLSAATAQKEGLPDGEPSLRRALALNAQDFDAQASLGGILKRRQDLAGAAAAYAAATQLSNGHPYPLLNELVLSAHLSGALDLSGRDRQLRRAERARQAQATNSPPYDMPWSAYDVALIRLLRNDAAGFGEYTMLGLDHTQQAWQARTFLNTLRLLPAMLLDRPTVRDTLRTLENASG